MPETQVWIVDDDSSIRWVLERALSAAQLSVRSFGNAEEVLVALGREQPEVLLSDVRMPGSM